MTEIKSLLVDSDVAFSNTVKNVLSAEQISVSHVFGSEEALKWLELAPDVDVVLLDAKLSAADDYNLLIEIRRRFPTVKVILLTDSTSLELVIGSMRQGAFDYLIKPGELGELPAKIEKAKLERTRHQAKILAAIAKALEQKWLGDQP